MKIKFPKEIQKLIVEYIIYQFLFTRCQKKRYDQGYGTLKLAVFRERQTVEKDQWG